MFSEKEKIRILKQIIASIVYCHNYNIFNGNLKPENILFLDKGAFNRIQIMDIGITQVINEDILLLTKPPTN